jgi:TRAP-type C4-dicarboxylate transport system substrate-binding protein
MEEEAAMIRILSVVAALACATAVAATTAGAQELPRTNVKIVGENSTIINSSKLEMPFWQETIPAASNGMVTGDLTPTDQMGIDNAATLRLLKLGAMDFGTTDLSRLAADDPRFEGCDLAGIALTVDKVREACNAYRPVLDRLMRENWNAKLLFLGIAQPQVFWCKPTVQTLADLEGKKIRVFNKTMIDFVEAAGGTGISMAFPEVIPALQRGVIDCAVTGTLSGNTSGWPEVTTNIYPMSLGWAVRFTAVNLNSWERFDPKVRQFFEEQFAAHEDRGWELMAQAVEDAENCNTGRDPCTLGKKANLVVQPIRPEDLAEYEKLMETVVLRNFAQRCGDACTKEWNDTVGKALELTAAPG